MSVDTVFGFALGVACGVGIGALILAWYHEQVARAIGEAEEVWAPDYEALHLAYDHALEVEVIAISLANLSPEEWLAERAK